jgi:hypothetical protein
MSLIDADRRAAMKEKGPDWLAQQITEHCSNKEGKIDADKLMALAKLNGLDPSAHANKNVGMIRMSVGNMLRKAVRDTGELKLNKKGESVKPPKGWSEGPKAAPKTEPAKLKPTKAKKAA